MNKAYDIAFMGELLIATVPHGQDIEAAARAECENADIPFSEISVVESVTLTNEEPDDLDRIVYSGFQMGALLDENGVQYDYALRADPIGNDEAGR